MSLPCVLSSPFCSFQERRTRRSGQEVGGTIVGTKSSFFFSFHLLPTVSFLVSAWSSPRFFFLAVPFSFLLHPSYPLDGRSSASVSKRCGLTRQSSPPRLIVSNDVVSDDLVSFFGTLSSSQFWKKTAHLFAHHQSKVALFLIPHGFTIQISESSSCVISTMFLVSIENIKWGRNKLAGRWTATYENDFDVGK